MLEASVSYATADALYEVERSLDDTGQGLATPISPLLKLVVFATRNAHLILKTGQGLMITQLLPQNQGINVATLSPTLTL